MRKHGAMFTTDDLDRFGVRAQVEVIVYPSRHSMLDAANRFNGGSNPEDTAAVTQYMEAIDGAPWPIIRLCEPDATTEVVAHELHHAVWALVGASSDADARVGDVFCHYNEPAAYLYGNMFTLVTRWLYQRGIWR